MIELLHTVTSRSLTIHIQAINDDFRSVGTFRVLAQAAYLAGTRVTLICGDPQVYRLATNEGIPIFRDAIVHRRALHGLRLPSIRTLTRVHLWRPARLSPVAIGGVVLTAGMAVLLLFLWLPVATVVLTPASQLLTGEVEMHVDPRLTIADTAGGRIPARTSRYIIELNEPILTAGRVADNGARARGIVLFSNRLGDGSVRIPAGMVVATTSGAKYATDSDVQLDSPIGAQVRVNVTALQPGDNSNVGRLDISRVYGVVGSRVSVLNEAPIAGGGQSLAPVITQADHERARAAAIQRARTDGMRRIRDEARTNETVLPTTYSFTTISEAFDHAVGTRTSAFTYRLKAEAVAQVVLNDHLRQVALAKWKPSLPANSFAPEPQLQVMSPTVIGRNGDTILLRVPLQTLAVQNVDSEQIKSLVIWRQSDELRRDLIRTLNLATEPRVTLQPRWAERAMRVNVVLDLNEPIATPVPAARTNDG